MEPSTQLDLEAPPQTAQLAREGGLRRSLEARARQGVKRAILWLHRQADRFDLIPSEWGQEVEVDDQNGRSVAREWIRQVKLWAGYNPEEMFALKAGAIALGLAFVILIVIVGAVR